MKYTKESNFKSLAFWLFAVFCTFSGCSSHYQPHGRTSSEGDGLSGLGGLETGDMVFLDLDCGEICDAIETVTLEQFKVDGPRLSHMGVVEAVHDKTYVWESWPEKGVQRVPLNIFLARVKGGEDRAGGYYIGRLKKGYRMTARKIVASRMSKFEDRPYDDIFVWGSDKFYCSEFVAQSFGPNYFRPQPMYFGEPGSVEYEVWKKYYAEKKKPMPVGKPGISPLGIYLAGKEKFFVTDSGVGP